MEHAIQTPTKPAVITIPWTFGLPFPLRNLLRRWRGTVAMIAGVGIALSVVMTLAVLGKASIEIYTSDFIRSGADLYVYQRGGTLVPALPGEGPGTIAQGRSTLARIRALPEVQAAIAIMTWPMEREREGPRQRDMPTELITTVGVDGNPSEIPNLLVLDEGRWIRRSGEVFLGTKVSREKQLGIGDTLRLQGRDFTVVGIGKLRGFGFGTDSFAYLDYRAFRDRAPVGDVFSTIAVDTAQPEVAKGRIAGLGSLAVDDRDDLVQQAEAVQSSAVALYYIFDALSLAVAAIFVITTLNNNVSQRRIEFATMRAIGIPQRMILTTVGIEAMTICILGGVLAVPISLLLGWWINVAVAEPLGIEAFYNPDLGSFAIIFGLALGLGFISGLFPARRATSVDPVDVLREA